MTAKIQWRDDEKVMIGWRKSDGKMTKDEKTRRKKDTEIANKATKKFKQKDYEK